MTEYPDGTIEHEGRLWKPKPGVSCTAEKFLAARQQFLELHQESNWNPWVLEDRAVEIDQATEVMGQWTRAEPGHTLLTDTQLDAMYRRQDRSFQERREAELRRFEKNSEHYDPERESARLALLEQGSRLEHEIDEVRALRSCERFPAMDPKKRAEQVAELGASIALRQAEVSRLGSLVGDPEQVVDVHGRLPSDRRVTMLTLFTAHRSAEVRALRETLPELTSTLQESTDKSARAGARRNFEQARSRLGMLLAIPRPVADDMCSECPTPIARHGWRTPPAEGPCPAWPRWAAKIRDIRRMLDTSAREQCGTEPMTHKRAPLAVVSSGLPIADVIEQLTELQAKHPNSEVRRGRANRWELWPTQSTED